jgi:hypothetical protein
MEGIGLLFLLSIKHVIADYFLQKSWMIKEKGMYGAQGGIAHASIHSIGTFLVLFPFFNPVLIFILSVLDGIAHYHIDYFKSNYRKGKPLSTNDAEYWMIHGVDQFTHFVTYILIASILVMWF